ncbi:TetR/AcrR family transcriptional regulator C-terminal ligand-binding domain-containing protein [Nocardia sp. IBHARD005]|uniref:TetR/AcrR family transcriptional regulator C-terminal ligand-binding domain-containing protein n=1 Tax=Nocardia sp. IBHARD005 TaxID=3457765 RepID=UPI0040599809
MEPGKAVRAHTGRKRNDAAKQAILRAVPAVLAAADRIDITMSEIAAAAGVGKQTIYRWWPSRGALLLDAMSEWASGAVPEPDTGNRRADVAAFLRATFAAASAPPADVLLRAILADAQRDRQVADLLAEFVAVRRGVLARILARDGADSDDVELLVDQAFGVLWYRLAVTRAPLGADLADRLADSLCAAPAPTNP